MSGSGISGVDRGALPIGAGRANESRQPRYILVRLDFHVARKTDAYTTWRVRVGGGSISVEEAVERGLMIPKGSNKNYFKTHWDELYLVDPSVRLVRVRMSNRGNLHVNDFDPRELEVREWE